MALLLPDKLLRTCGEQSHSLLHAMFYGVQCTMYMYIYYFLLVLFSVNTVCCTIAIFEYLLAVFKSHKHFIVCYYSAITVWTSSGAPLSQTILYIFFVCLIKKGFDKILGIMFFYIVNDTQIVQREIYLFNKDIQYW